MSKIKTIQTEVIETLSRKDYEKSFNGACDPEVSRLNTTRPKHRCDKDIQSWKRDILY